MKTLASKLCRVLCALMLCAGFAFVGCTDDPLGGGENTEQGGNNDGDGSGESASLVSVSLGKVTATTVQFDMTLDLKVMSQYEEAGLVFSSVDDLDISAETATIFQINRESYSKVFTGLTYNTKYYYTTYLKKGTFYLYGDKKEFTTPDVLLELSVGSITATTAQITGIVEGLSESDKSLIEVGLLYSSESGQVENGQGDKLAATEISSDNAVSFDLTELSYGTKYYYCSYVKQGEGYVYGEVKEFVAGSVSVNLSAGSITATSAQITGTVEGLSESDKSLIEVGLLYSLESGQIENGQGAKLAATEISSDNAVLFDLSDLIFGTKYYYCSYVKQNGSYTYGETREFNTVNVIPTVSVVESSITSRKATLSGMVSNLSDSDKSCLEFGVAYSTSSSNLKSSSSVKESVTLLSDGTFSVSLENLNINTKYYYCSYVKQNGSYTYGETREFNTVNVIPSVSVVESSITATTATLSGMVSNLSDSDKSCLEFGVAYSTSSSNLKSSSSVKESVTLLSDGTFSVSLENLNINTKYYYCSYVKHNGNYTYGETKDFTTSNPYSTPADLNVASAIDLSYSASANCYIISASGLYKFKTVKGNSTTSVGSVSKAGILWETFGTSTTPQYCDLIKAFCYKDGYIAFQTAETFKEGNAVIAAKDASGNILWSWHIWFTDQPQGQEYYNNAGVMMDRNLGATSATPGDVGALGLLYQWGRKDPFLGSSSISSSTLAKSTITWPSVVESNASNGTIEYATAHPTTYITYNKNNYDWYYTGSSSIDNTRWTTSSSDKSIFDPCPAGWRVPDGGSNGIWSNALGSSSFFTQNSLYDSINEGMNFSGKFGSEQIIWYPASGDRFRDGSLDYVGYYGHYWSASPNNYYAYDLSVSNSGGVSPSRSDLRACGQSVRCLQE